MLARTIAAAGASSLLVLLSLARSVADVGDAPSYPFVPPVGWRALPASSIPRPLVSWSDGKSQEFVITSLDVQVPIESFQRAMAAQGALAGTVDRSTLEPVCNAPATEIVVHGKSGAILTEQAQALDGKVYVSVYTRPDAVPADAGIAAAMAGFCGSASLAALAPPANWNVSATRFLGSWTSPTFQLMMLIGRSPETDVQKAAREAAANAFKNASVTIESTTTGTLCGNPATFLTIVARPNGVAPSELRMEMTQNATSGYVLMYVRPVGTQADDAALASLASLCANVPAPAPARTSAP